MTRLPLLILALAVIARPFVAKPDPWVRHQAYKVIDIRTIHHKNAACDLCRPGGEP